MQTHVAGNTTGGDTGNAGEVALAAAGRERFEGFRITHFSPREGPPPASYWRAVFFLSQSSSGNFAWGLETAHSVKPERMPGILTLPAPIQVQADKQLWLTDDGALVYADIQDPLSDQSQIVVVADYRTCLPSYDPNWGQKLVTELEAKPEPARQKEIIREMAEEMHVLSRSGGQGVSEDDVARFALFERCLKTLAQGAGFWGMAANSPFGPAAHAEALIAHLFPDQDDLEFLAKMSASVK